MMRRRTSARVLLALVVLLPLACAPVDDRRSVEPVDRSRAKVQPLVAEERYVEAFGIAAEELRKSVTATGFDSLESHAWLLHTGTIAHLAGEQATAQLLLDAALTSADRGAIPSAAARGETLYRRGLVHRYQMQLPQADEFYRRARLLLEREAPDSPVLLALMQAEASRMRYGDLDSALRTYRQVAELRSVQAQPSIERADTLTWTAWAHSHYGHADDAEPYRRRAFDELERLGIDNPVLLATLERLVAEERSAEGDWGEAALRFERAIVHYTDSHRGHFPGFGRRKSPVHGGMGLALAYLKLGREQDAWNVLQRASSTLTREAAALGSWRDSGSPEYAEWRRQGREYLQARQQLRRALGSDPNYRSSSTVDSLLSLVTLRRALLELERDIHDASDVPSLDEVRAALAPNEALFGVLRTTVGALRELTEERGGIGEIWVYIVRPGRPLRWMPISTAETAISDESARALEYRIRNMLFEVARWPGQAEGDPLLDRLLLEYGSIFEGVHAELDDVERLVVDGYPFVPLEILRRADGSHWVDRYTIGYVPSTSSFVSGRSEPAPRVGELARALIIADPIMPAERRGEATAATFRSTTRSMVEPDELEALRRLPFTGLEGAAVAGHFEEATLLRRGEATERRIGHVLAEARRDELDVLHVATHGVGSPLPERMGFVVTAEGRDDGVIDAEDVRYGWPVRSRLVTLSGCRTAGILGSYERVGLPQAFIAAGAENVVMSSWDIDDRATSLMMERFYEELHSRSETPAPAAIHESLRAARLWLRDYRDADGTRPYAHPAYWSGLLSVGRL